MLVIDSDMQLRHPFRPDKYNMMRGKAISADYTYMIGCTNDLAPRHIPEIAKRNDTLAGPMHRYCDMVRYDGTSSYWKGPVTFMPLFVGGRLHLHASR